MINSVLLAASIFLSSLGLNGLSANIDQSIIQKNSITAAAEIQSSLPEVAPRPIIDPSVKDPNVFVNNYILVDSESNVILAQQFSHEQVPIASTTKIMTAVLVLENYDLNEVVTISSEAANQIGADAHFRTGEEITVYELLKTLLIKSANGAAYAFAEHMNEPGSEGIDLFINKMNEKAHSLGMMNTNYHDPAGLDTTGYSSAYDLYLITKYALKFPVFSTIVATKSDTAKDVTGSIWHQLDNSNRLVKEWDYPGILGVKTGYMPEAGHCLVSAAKRDGHTLIGVVLKTYSDTASASALESQKLLDWGFNNTKWE